MGHVLLITALYNNTSPPGESANVVIVRLHDVFKCLSVGCMATFLTKQLLCVTWQLMDVGKSLGWTVGHNRRLRQRSNNNRWDDRTVRRNVRVCTSRKTAGEVVPFRALTVMSAADRDVTTDSQHVLMCWSASVFAIWIVTQTDAQVCSLVTFYPVGTRDIFIWFPPISTVQRGLQGHYCAHRLQLY